MNKIENKKEGKKSQPNIVTMALAIVWRYTVANNGSVVPKIVPSTDHCAIVPASAQWYHGTGGNRLIDTKNKE